MFNVENMGILINGVISGAFFSAFVIGVYMVIEVKQKREKRY